MGRSAVFSLGKTPIEVEAPHDTYRENALRANALYLGSFGGNIDI